MASSSRWGAPALPACCLGAASGCTHHTGPRCTAGGEFFSHLKSRGRLSEEAARLYAGEVLLMFEYLHALDVVYRDLKVGGPALEQQRPRARAPGAGSRALHTRRCTLPCTLRRWLTRLPPRRKSSSPCVRVRESLCF